MKIPSRTILYKNINLSKEITTNLTNTTFQINYRIEKSGFTGTVGFKVFSDSLVFQGFDIDGRHLDKKSETVFIMELKISSNNSAISALKIWGESNAISFKIYWVGHVPHIKKEMGPTNLTIEDLGTGNFSFYIPWNLQVIGYVREILLCADGSCPWWMPNKNSCPRP
jgi:hypothetical protein